MSDGHLRRIKAAVYRIELTPKDVCPIHSLPYPAGLNSGQFQKAETDHMLLMRVIEPELTEWASPIAFVPINDGSLCFCAY